MFSFKSDAVKKTEQHYERQISDIRLQNEEELLEMEQEHESEISEIKKEYDKKIDFIERTNAVEMKKLRWAKEDMHDEHVRAQEKLDTLHAETLRIAQFDYEMKLKEAERNYNHDVSEIKNAMNRMKEEHEKQIEILEDQVIEYELKADRKAILADMERETILKKAEAEGQLIIANARKEAESQFKLVYGSIVDTLMSRIDKDESLKDLLDTVLSNYPAPSDITVNRK